MFFTAPCTRQTESGHEIPQGAQDLVDQPELRVHALSDAIFFASVAAPIEP
jgi:hypothetical protein